MPAALSASCVIVLDGMLFMSLQRRASNLASLSASDAQGSAGGSGAVGLLLRRDFVPVNASIAACTETCTSLGVTWASIHPASRLGG
jgi:hypothetical protein